MLLFISRRISLSLIITLFFIHFYFFAFFSDLQAGSLSFQTEKTPNSVNIKDFIPGDAVQITVYPDTTSFLNNTFPIDAQGYVFLPILGKVQIINMSIVDFERFLVTNYSQYLRVTIVKIRPLIRGGLFGGFTQPGFYYIDKNATLWNLVSRGIAVTSDKALKQMKWERNGDTIESNLIPLIQSGRSLSEIGFRSGDQIYTPPPRERTFFDKIAPFIYLGITVYTLYITTYNYYYYQNR